MSGRVAWVLNLDADLELASADGRYVPTKAVQKVMAPHLERLAASLVAPADVLVTETSAPGSASGLEGRAFCPTTRAVALLDRAGARPVAHPAQEVLRRVNGRAFCASLGQTLEGARFATEVDSALEVLAAAPKLARQWRVKRAFGMAGRGQRRIRPGEVSAADVSFLRSSMASEGGVQIEPDVTIGRELGVHGMVEADGSVRLGRLVEQRCDEHGQWLETVVALDVDAAVATRLETEARGVGEALYRAGYFGPFGIDAFLYRDLEGNVLLQPRSEINARYSMGFAVGYGGR